jgi:hypothetical protein
VHLMQAWIIVVAIAAVYAWHFAPETGLWRRIAHGVAVAAVVIVATMLILLILLPGPTCKGLGGTWTGVSCKNEWGGDGVN